MVSRRRPPPELCRTPVVGSDLFERRKGQLWVVDLKTGVREAEPTPAQRDQLLFYCGLVDAVIGQKPTHAAVSTTSGDQYHLSFEWPEVEKVLDDAVNILMQLNLAGSAGMDESQATPIAESCGCCPYLPACDPFFDACEETWPTPHALQFEIRSVEPSPHGLSVEAVVLRPGWRQGEDIHVLGFPFEYRTGGRRSVGGNKLRRSGFFGHRRLEYHCLQVALTVSRYDEVNRARRTASPHHRQAPRAGQPGQQSRNAFSAGYIDEAQQLLLETGA